MKVGEVLSFYTLRKNNFLQDLQRKKKQLAWFSFLRVTYFLFLIAVSWYLVSLNVLLGILVILVLLVVFGAMISIFQKLSREKEKVGFLVKINEQEERAVQYDYSFSNGGDKYISIQHPFTYDLDVFGEGSVFQVINRTVTLKGEKLLAHILQEPRYHIQEILKSSEAIKELSNEIDFLQDFLAEGMFFSEIDHQEKEIKMWLDEKDWLLNKWYTNLLVWIMPSFTVLTLILAIFEILPYILFFTMGILQLTISGLNIKKVNQVHEKLDKKYALIIKHSRLIGLIQNKNFNSELLQDAKNSFLTGKKDASSVLKTFSKILNMFDSRMNLFVAIVFNGLFLWDLRIVLQLEKWKKEYGEKVLTWLEGTGKFDAYISLSIFAHNHPQYSYPILKEENHFIFNAMQLGHPLIPSEKRVDNDLSMEKWGSFVVITGANMSGKSTFLRAVGLNSILAMAGLPVCALKFEFSPVPVFTSMRTNDSLQKNESYFYTELKRIKAMLDQIEKDHKVFILLDEILKGTNSIDKQKGSKAILEKLIRSKSSGIIATHDLSLGELEKNYPNELSNKCFEIDINDSNMKFDFKLREGITRHMNAILLMKKMGIL
ncbi:MAG: MutS-related protein [bacterium]